MANQGLTAEAFAAKLKLEKKLVETVVIEKQGIIAGAVFEQLVEVTPVLTGKARNNWNPSIGERDASEHPTAGVSRTGASMTSGERGKIELVKQQLRRKPLGQIVYLTNGLVYVVFLDEGSSKKAPAGIRLVAVQQAISKLRGQL